jgi:hypothetical protein
VHAYALARDSNDITEAVAYVTSLLAEDGWDVDALSLGTNATARTTKADRDSIAGVFQHTPQALIDSWNYATDALAAVGDEGVILVDDRSGLAGILAVELSNRRLDSPRQVWTVAGDSVVLRRLWLGGSLAGADDEEESVVDWEIAQYRFSDRVICRSPIEAALLAEVGVEADVASNARGTAMAMDGSCRNLYVPGPVSRLNSFPEILRSVADLPDVSVVFGVDDDDDRYWTGTTWEAFESSRRLLGDQLSRASVMPDGTDLVVLGHPFADHKEIVEQAISLAIPVATQAGSIVAQ